jgi:hypothetical protein
MENIHPAICNASTQPNSRPVANHIAQRDCLSRANGQAYTGRDIYRYDISDRAKPPQSGFWATTQDRPAPFVPQFSRMDGEPSDLLLDNSGNVLYQYIH